MNEPIKYMIAGAAIAVVCGVAGGVTVGMVQRGGEGSSQKPVFSSQRMPVSDPSIPQSAFRTPNSTSFRTPNSGGSSAIRHSALRTPNSSLPPPIMRKQFEELQAKPEIKAAHDAYIEAQKKYMAAMKGAMPKVQPAASSGILQLKTPEPPKTTETAKK